jgi:hypothetical protein
VVVVLGRGREKEGNEQSKNFHNKNPARRKVVNTYATRVNRTERRCSEILCSVLRSRCFSLRASRALSMTSQHTKRTERHCSVTLCWLRSRCFSLRASRIPSTTSQHTNRTERRCSVILCCVLRSRCFSLRASRVLSMTSHHTNRPYSYQHLPMRRNTS